MVESPLTVLRFHVSIICSDQHTHVDSLYMFTQVEIPTAMIKYTGK